MGKKVDDLAYFNIFSFQIQSHKSAIFQNLSKWLKIVVSSIDMSKILNDDNTPNVWKLPDSYEESLLIHDLYVHNWDYATI